jgi:hypothetical protein
VCVCVYCTYVHTNLHTYGRMGCYVCVRVCVCVRARERVLYIYTYNYT